MNLLVLIPVYNHAGAIGYMVEGVLRHHLPCLLVDDGSDADCAAELDRLAAAHPHSVRVLRLAQNRGKGGAVLAGVAEAQRLGYTHALQIDADGQHDPAEIPKFVIAAAGQPEAVICGTPQFDASVPRGRLYGRYLTHVWVWINTLGFAIKDSMCGFRVYPLAPVAAIAASEKLGQRMDFDTEILVRMYWRGLPVVNLPTPVTYPRDGVSHFDVWRDNVFITRMHTRLFFGMLWRAPRLLWRKVRA